MKKTLSIILCLVIVLSAFGIIPVQFAAVDVDNADTGADVEVAETGNPYPTTQNVDKDNYYEIPCTWFAWQQAYDRLGISLPSWGNAVNWWQGAQNAGYSTGSTPQPDSIAVWSGDYYGHVAYVTSVSGGNTFTVNEGGRTDLDQTDSHGIAYGYTLTNAVGGSRPYDTGKTLLGFIYLYSGGSLKANVGGSQAYLNWDWDNNADYYNIKIWKNKAYEGDPYRIVWSVQNNNYGFALPKGTYQAYVDACKDSTGYCKMSNIVTFSIR